MTKHVRKLNKCLILNNVVLQNHKLNDNHFLCDRYSKNVCGLRFNTLLFLGNTEFISAGIICVTNLFFNLFDVFIGNKCVKAAN